MADSWISSAKWVTALTWCPPELNLDMQPGSAVKPSADDAVNPPVSSRGVVHWG